MMNKTIKVETEVHAKLERKRKKQEVFNDVIKNLFHEIKELKKEIKQLKGGKQ